MLSYWSNQNSRQVGHASTCTGRALTNTSTDFSAIVVLQLGQAVIRAFYSAAGRICIERASVSRYHREAKQPKAKMQGLVIWGRDNSVNVQKVLWCCEEIGLPYQRIDAGGTHGVVNTPSYREINPNGLVPTMDEDGFILWESNAIVRYLAAKYASHRLWPIDPRTRAIADQWMDWQTSTFWPTLRPLFIGLIRTEPAQRDAQALEYARSRTAALLEIMDKHLRTRQFMAGDDFTPADIALGACTLRWMELPIEREEFMHVRRWFERLVERPAFRKVVMRPLT